MTTSDAELWEARARAAEDAAEQLTLLAGDLEKVLRRYYFGTDCIEGQELHAALTRLFESIGDELSSAGADARQLSATCRNAAAMLADSDDDNAAGFADGPPG